MAFRNKRRERELSFNDDNFADENNRNSNNSSSHGYHNPDYNPGNFWQEHEYERQDFDDVNDRYPEDYERVFEDFDDRNSRMRAENNHFVSRRRNSGFTNPNFELGSEEEGYNGRNSRDYEGDYETGNYYKPGDHDQGDLRNDNYYEDYAGERADRNSESDYFERVPSYYHEESRARSYHQPLYGNDNIYPEGRYNTSRREFENWGDGDKKNTRDERTENYRRRRPNIRENRN